MTDKEKEAIMSSVKTLFDMMYMPIAMLRERLNGSGFIVVAVDIIDSIRRQNTSPDVIKQSAIALVKCFNEQLNPKMSTENCIGMAKLFISDSDLLRSVADDLIKSGYGYLK